MPVSEIVMVCLMAFVLLVPTLMVAVLVSGISRRSTVAVLPSDLAVDADPVATPSAA